MKCPQCRHNHPVKQGMKCSKCFYPFTFNPKESRSKALTDGKFETSIRKASQNGTAVFTKNQLYAAYAKIATGSGFVPLVIGIFLVITGVFTFFFIFSQIGLMILAFGGFFLLTGLFGNAKPISRSFFLQGVQRWQKAGKPIEGLIDEPSLQTPPADWAENDIYQYGVERILIVQRDILVDLMVKNNQHSEQRMLVIAESGYPEYLQPRVKQLLDESDDLSVFLLHDATASGKKMKQRVLDLKWLPLRSHRLIDLGFFRDDYAKLKRADTVRGGYQGNDMPADALMLGAMTLALGACFSTNSVIADEITREATNTANSGSSFG